MNSMATATYQNLMNGFGSRFDSSLNLTRYKGFNISGILVNLIALICVYFSQSLPINYYFLIYLIVGDVGFLFSIVTKYQFYKKCQKNELSFQIQNVEKQIPLLENKNTKTKKDFKQKKYSSLSKKPETIETQDFNRVSGSRTLSKFQIIKKTPWLYFLLSLNYFSTYSVFPTLCFDLDFSAWMSFKVSFIFVSF